jgi:acetolactate synthase-1/2/3 large subunit
MEAIKGLHEEGREQIGKKNFDEVPVSNGAEAFLEQIRACEDVRFIFANTGTDHGPIIEALAKSEKDGIRDPQVILVPHELAAVSMAHGYYNVKQHAQVVLVHTLPGTANSLGGLLNAHSANIPLVLVAGRTPVTEGELPGGKSRHIHWRQESRDQGSIVREFVKWDYENRSNKNLPTVVSRAFKIAMTEPRGPVYLTMPREWLCESLETTRLVRDSFKPATKIQADMEALEKAADLLISAESPLIVTRTLGRNPQAVSSLVELAELLSIPVVQLPSYVNFPTDHPLSLGSQALKYAKGSDVIFLIDVDVPWHSTSREILRPDAKILQLDRDPLFTSIPVWGFPVDHAITGCSETSLPILNAKLKRALTKRPEMKKVCEERRKRVRKEHDSMMREGDVKIESVRNDKPIHPLWISKCLGDVMDDNTILIGETVTSPLAEVTGLKAPGSFFGLPPAGHLGWGPGAAIGAKLAAPDHTVIAAEGDGAYIFSAPTACHFTAEKYGIPFLTVVYNNQAWNASISTVRELYPDGVAEKSRNFPACDLSPSPRFELTAEACGAYAERVEDPGALKEALRRALKVVREEKRQALLNVICKSPI